MNVGSTTIFMKATSILIRSSGGTCTGTYIIDEGSYWVSRKTTILWKQYDTSVKGT